MGIPIPTINPPNRNIFTINKFSGLNKSVTPSQIENNQSPDMLNLELDEAGALNKRTGYKKIFNSLIGSEQWSAAQWSSAYWEGDSGADTKINNLWAYRKSDGSIERLLSHGAKLYKWDDTGNQPTEISGGMADAVAGSFQVDSKIYFVDGTNYKTYNGTSLTDATIGAYIPTVTLGRTPTGGGTPNEQWNLIGAGFKDSFSSNGSATVYTLSYSGLDATTVLCTIAGVTKTEGTHFTVDRTAGTVNFAAGTSPNGAPASGTNNVVITAYKTQSAKANEIKNCTLATLYGGSNDTRILLSGNPNYLNKTYRSGINASGYADPTYFPENTYSLVGANNDPIQGMVKQYDSLIVYKQNAPHSLNYELNNGVGVFTSKPVNDSVGLYARNTLQLCDNAPIGLHKDGVYRLIQSNTRDERNMQHISEAIDSDLLSESNLSSAVAYDYDGKYYLTINNNCYVYDYRSDIWYKWDNIKASCFLEYNGYLYFGSNADGLVYRFYRPGETGAYSDDGEAINSYWFSKLLTFDADTYLKIIDRCYVNIKPNSATSVDIYYSNDRKPLANFVKTVSMYSFDFTNFDFRRLSFVAFSNIPKGESGKIKQKKTLYIQFKLVNDKLDESLGMLSFSVEEAIQKRVR